jgi:hypothetical protein
LQLLLTHLHKWEDLFSLSIRYLYPSTIRPSFPLFVNIFSMLPERMQYKYWIVLLYKIKWALLRFICVKALWVYMGLTNSYLRLIKNSNVSQWVRFIWVYLYLYVYSIFIFNSVFFWVKFIYFKYKFHTEKGVALLIYLLQVTIQKKSRSWYIKCSRF